ncbi:hypothetical protein [Litorimonas taeanensis]|nr:hypothetical protein [Litorimonas taeanensis]
MSEIYTLTSAHLYGIIHRILPEDPMASRVLKSVYARVWERRHEIAKQVADPVVYLRTLAHRYAIDYKFTHNIKSVLEQKSAIESNGKIESLKGLNIKPADIKLLRRAYLDGLSCEDLADLEGTTANDVRTRLAQLSHKLNQEVL